MTRTQRLGVFGLCVLMAGGALLPALLRGAAPAKQAKRSDDDIIKDLGATDEKITGIMPSLALLADPAFQKGDGQKVVPLLNQSIALFRELEAASDSPDGREIAQMNRYRYLAYETALGNKEAFESLEKASKIAGPEEVMAHAALNLGKWLNLSKNSEEQGAVIKDMDLLAKANPTSDVVAGTLGFMANLGGSNNDLTKKIIEVIRADIKIDGVQSMLTQLDSVQTQIALLGKPIAVEGRTSTGSHFSLSSYRGKVVLIDFWATWCVPCIDELPNVKSAYKDFHAKGLEIVGVSCDNEDGVLNSFIKEHEMGWVQLREESQNENAPRPAGADPNFAPNWHPIAIRYGVNGIPAMFLVDKKGILRFVDAREDLAAKVQQLLAEPDGPPIPAGK